MDYKKREIITAKANNYWDSFTEEIISKNRFFPNHPITEFIKSYAGTHKTVLSKGTLLYRARNIDITSSSTDNLGIVKYLQGQDFGEFEGFDEQNSFAPPSNSASAGRINPERIVYLYTACEVITAIAETRPKLLDQISVAKIELLQDITLVDLRPNYNNDSIDFSSELIRNITTAFSRPCKNELEYIPTQFISEYIKSLGYDGVLFQSSFNIHGTNVTLFYPTMAKAIASTIYRMDDITYRARRILPRNSLESFEIIATNKEESRI